MVTKRNTEQTIKGSFELINLQERNKAAATFRAAFIEDIMILNDALRQRDLPPGYVPDIIKSSIKGHTKAYIKLSPYLSSEEKMAFDKAWKGYTDPEDIQKEGLDPFNPYFADEKIVEECIHLAASNINQLVELAKPQKDLQSRAANRPQSRLRWPQKLDNVISSELAH